MRTGLIVYGANNIFTVVSEGKSFLCRIKGKILRHTEQAYNPLAPGDMVSFQTSETEPDRGMIIDRLERRNAFIRWNRKREAPQTVAANLDVVVCVASVGIPPFRPRFVDRVLVAAGAIPTVVVVNKSDLAVEEWEEERIEGYSHIGYELYRCSAETGKGVAALRERIRGLRSVFVGQSGVGKSSLLNYLVPGGGLETGEVSSKYDRGRHTTKNARLYQTDEAELVDTPGIRQIELYGIDAEELQHHFLDFVPYMGGCAFQSCSHREEPDCRIKDAVDRGEIQADRYESYLRLYEELKEREPYG